MTDPDYLARRPANFQPLTPIQFLERAPTPTPAASR